MKSLYLAFVVCLAFSLTSHAAHEEPYEEYGYLYLIDVVGLSVWGNTNPRISAKGDVLFTTNLSSKTGDPNFKKTESLEETLTRCIGVRDRIQHQLKVSFLVLKASCKAKRLTTTKYEEKVEKLREQRNYFHEEKWTELGLEKKQELAEARDFSRYDL